MALSTTARATMPPQEPAPVKPADLDEVRWFLHHAERLRIRSDRSDHIELDRFGPGQPYEVALRAEDQAWLRSAAATVRLAEPSAGRPVHQQLDLLAADGRFLRVSVTAPPIRMVTTGFGDAVLADGDVGPLFEHVQNALRRARHAQARLDLSDRLPPAPWAPADDWDGRLAVWEARQARPRLVVHVAEDG